MKTDAGSRSPVLVVVEGIHDISFLKAASRILSCDGDRSSLPDLAQMESQTRLIFLPVGGSHSGTWANRLRPLGLAEFHLFDRDLAPLTDIRLAVAQTINRRPRCRAFVTTRRQLENYLHPRAIYEATGLRVTFGEHDDVAEIVARTNHAKAGEKAWERLSGHRRHKLCRRAKRWLNTLAVERMTPELFTERDPAGDIASWLRCIGELADGGLGT